MKFFANILPTTALVAALALGAAAQSANAVLNSVALITQTTNNYNTQFKRVSANNIAHEGASVPEGVNSLTELITNQLIDVFLQDDTPTKLTGRDAANVVTAYQASSDAAQALITTFLEDHDLFAQYALTNRVTQSVRAYRAASMQYMGAIKAVAESRGDDIMNAYSGLADIFETLIQLYEQS